MHPCVSVFMCLGMVMSCLVAVMGDYICNKQEAGGTKARSAQVLSAYMYMVCTHIQIYCWWNIFLLLGCFQSGTGKYAIDY